MLATALLSWYNINENKKYIPLLRMCRAKKLITLMKIGVMSFFYKKRRDSYDIGQNHYGHGCL